MELREVESYIKHYVKLLTHDRISTAACSNITNMQAVVQTVPNENISTVVS